MIALHRALPLLVGSAAIGALVYALALWSPMPADLSAPHARIEGASALEGCATCHAPRGLSAGCIACHGEIAAQLEGKRGYHHHLIGAGDPACARCHAEHNGAHFDIVNEVSWGAQAWRGFRHAHVPFGLTGRHAEVACEECHAGERRAAFADAVAVALEGGALVGSAIAGAPPGGPPASLGTGPAPIAGAPAPALVMPAGLTPGRGSAPTPATRERSFLGLGQECARCHADPHAGGLSGDCARCHGQQRFDPPTFAHAKFPRTGPHARLDCRRCHLIPEPDTPSRPAPFPFDHARGATCEKCHDTPHQAFTTRCETCHEGAEPSWGTALGRVTVEKHDPSGFRLRGAHTAVACEKCHARALPLEARYPDRTAPGYLRAEATCQGCHTDVHRGQFAARHAGCLDCHEQGRFAPTTFGLEAHAARYPLTGAHRATACTACHAVDKALGARRFAGTERTCRGCHATPHGPQFKEEIAKGDCVACHEPSATTFQIRPFDHLARTGVKLEGAHYHMAKCESCHVPIVMAFAGREGPIRRYEGTPSKECAQCHRDAHRGQFAFYGKESCNRCHASSWSWKETRFNHETQSRFRLEGAHAKVACDRCHVPQRLQDGTSVVQYRPLGMECRSCHDIPTTDK